MGIFDSLRDSIKNRSPQDISPQANIGSDFAQQELFKKMPKMFRGEILRKLQKQMGNQQMQPAVMPNIPNMPNLQGRGGIPGLQNIDFSNLPMGMDFSNFDPRAINANPQGFQDMIEQAQAQEGLQGSLPVENSMGMVGTLGGPGYGEFPLGSAGPRVDPSDPNYIPPPTNRPTIQAPVQTTAPVQPTAPVQQPLAPYTGGNDPAPYVSNQLRNETGLDALSQQLLFGLDGKGGFIPGAMQAAETSFFNPDGTPRVVEQQVAGLTR